KSVAGMGTVATLSGYARLADSSRSSGNGSADAGTAASPGSAGQNAESKLLAARADDYLKQIFEVARGPGGLIISHSRFDTRLPLQEYDVPASLHQVLDSVWGKASPKPTVAEWYYGENTLWATGWLLWAQMIRYRVTRDAEAMRVARKCFQDLNHVFD